MKDANQFLVSGAGVKMSPINKPASLLIDSRVAETMAPGHGLLFALVGHSSLSSAGTPPSQLRQTTQILFSSSASTPSPTASALTSTAAAVTTTPATPALSSSTSSSSMSSHFPSSSDGSSQTTSTAVTMFMSSVNSKVVSSIAQRNSQAQHQQQGEPAVFPCFSLFGLLIESRVNMSLGLCVDDR